MHVVAAVQVAPGLRIHPRKLAITQVEAQDANGAPRSYLRLEWVASYSDPSVCAEEAMNPSVVFAW